MSANILRMRNISKNFSGVRALDDVSFDVKAGEIHGLVGENGAGKSTLMKVLSGVYGAGEFSGDILMDGKPCRFHTVRDSEKEGIAIIYQELAMVGCLSVCENLFIGHEIMRGHAIDWDEEYRSAGAVLRRVGLDASPDATIDTLSVGKQQLLEIAKALVRNVRLLILDEPTAALTTEETDKLFAILRELQSSGVTTVFISHKLNEILSMCDTVTVLRDGKTITSKPAAEFDEGSLIHHMVNRELTNRYPPKTNTVSDDILFEIRDWTVRHPQYREKKVVDNASLFVRKGEIVGISGLMGSGRTELATSVFGRVYGAGITGSLFLNGQEATLPNPGKAIKAGLSYLTEDRKGRGLVTIFDIKTNISMANLDKIIPHGLLLDENEETRIANHYRESLRIKTPNVEQRLENLSGGNQQKVVLAKCLNTAPAVLIVDEPTRGIDVGAKYEIYAILNEIATRGAAILVISSEMPELLGICDRIYVMHGGRIKGVFDRKDATQEAIMTMALTEQTASGGAAS